MDEIKNNTTSHSDETMFLGVYHKKINAAGHQFLDWWKKWRKKSNDASDSVKGCVRRYKKTVRFHYYTSVFLKLCLIVACLLGIIVITCSITGYCERLFVDGLFAKILLVFLLLVLLCTIGFVVNRLVVVGNRYRSVFSRLDVLLLRLDLDLEKDSQTSMLEKELQLITRTLES